MLQAPGTSVAFRCRRPGHCRAAVQEALTYGFGQTRNYWRNVVPQRVINASMSVCMRSMSSSDQAAPGFWLNLLCARGGGEVSLSLGDLRAAIFSLRVGRRIEEWEGLDGCIEG